MQTTANYGLKKPEGNDTVDIDVINGNMDTIDGQLKKLSGAMGDDPDFKTTISSAISTKVNQSDFNNHVNALTAHGIGDRTQLKTSSKDTIVNALNELKTAIPSVPVQSVNGKTGSVNLGASDITVSDSSNHFSSNPKNVENVLAELFTSGTNGKNDIYNAISAKGTTPASKNFSDLVSAIGNISTSPFSKTIQGADPLRVGTNRASINNGNYYIFQCNQNAIVRQKYNSAGTLLEAVNIVTGTWIAYNIKLIPYRNNRLLIAPNVRSYLQTGIYDWNGTLLFSSVGLTNYAFDVVAIFDDYSIACRGDSDTGVGIYDKSGTQIAYVANVTTNQGDRWHYDFRTLDAQSTLFFTGFTDFYIAQQISASRYFVGAANLLAIFQEYL